MVLELLFFRATSKLEDATDLYIRAGNAFKMAKKWSGKSKYSSSQFARFFFTWNLLQAEKFVLCKRKFFDAVNLLYRWKLSRYLPSICPCRKVYTLDHAMLCPKVGFMFQRHDNMKETIAHLLQETCRDVQIESYLTPLSGKNLLASTIHGDESQSDIAYSSKRFPAKRTVYIFWCKGV